MTIKEKKLQKLNNSIKKKNAAFNKLPKAKQIVTIAKDVLEQIEKGKYVPKENKYINVSSLVVSVDKHSDIDIQSNFDKIKECECCALGACLLSATKYKNKVLFSDLSPTSIAYRSNVMNVFKSLFTRKQLYLIECAFETQEGDRLANAGYRFSSINLTIKEKSRIENFHYRFRDSKNRLTAIMENIIKNKGVFKP